MLGISLTVVVEALFGLFNKSGSLKAILKDVIAVNHQFATFTDHMLVCLDLEQYRRLNSTRGYWKLNS